MENIIKRAYKFRFYPQNDLKILLAKTFGCDRFVFNKTLAFSEQHYKNKFTNKDILNPEYKSLSPKDRLQYLTVLKNIPEYSWLKEVSSIALQQSIRHLNTAYEKFFNKKSAYPQYKKKLNRNSFTITGQNSIHFDKDFLNNQLFYLPKYKKPLKIKFSRQFNHLAVSSYTISQDPSGKYFISFLVEEDLAIKEIKDDKSKCSIDLGLKTHAKVYNGEIFTDYNLPALLKNIDVKLRKSQSLLSRKKKGSKNRNKQRVKVAILHEKRNNILKDYYQKLSTQLINKNQVIIREDLNIKGMIKNRKLSRAIHNVAWGKFVNMLDYKVMWHKRDLIKVDRYYASSKKCSNCEQKNDKLKLSDREWKCECGAQHDRDENACINLYNYKEIEYKLNKRIIKKELSNTAVGTTVEACGGDVRPKSSKRITSMNPKAVSVETRILVL